MCTARPIEFIDGLSDRISCQVDYTPRLWCRRTAARRSTYMHDVISGFQIADTWLKGLKVRSFPEQTTYAMNPLDAILGLSLPRWWRQVGIERRPRDMER